MAMNIMQGLPLDPLFLEDMQKRFAQAPTADQVAMQEQMAAQATPQLPPPPTPKPASQVPVPQSRIVDSELQQAALKLKGYSAQRENEIEQLKKYMQDYAGMDQGTDYRAIAAFLGDKGLQEAAGAVAPETKAQRAQNMIGYQAKISQMIGDQRQAEAAARLYRDQMKMQTDLARDSRGERRTDLAESRDLEADVQRLEKRYGDMVPGMYKKLENLNNLIPGGLYGESDEGVPGVGPGAFLVPDFMMSDKASEIQQNARGLAADLIKVQSGAAASDLEVDRKMKELGMAPGSKSESFKTGMRRLHMQIVKEMENKRAAFRPEVPNTFEGRGGFSPADVQAIGQRPKTAPQEKEWNGKKYRLEGDSWVEVK